MTQHQSQPASSPVHPADTILITAKPLNAYHISDLLHHPAAGGQSIFIGTTRNHFQGKYVVQLEYETYETLAMKQLTAIASEIRSRYNTPTHANVHRIVLIHRIGVVPVGEGSVVCGVSSTHRKECLDAVEYAINAIKQRVAVWKKEVYADACPLLPDCSVCKEWELQQQSGSADAGHGKACNCQRNFDNPYAQHSAHHHSKHHQAVSQNGQHTTAEQRSVWKENAEFSVEALTQDPTVR
jgi:molybdopterin synthase catalytic subunit